MNIQFSTILSFQNQQEQKSCSDKSIEFFSGYFNFESTFQKAEINTTTRTFTWIQETQSGTEKFLKGISYILILPIIIALAIKIFLSYKYGSYQQFSPPSPSTEQTTPSKTITVSPLPTGTSEIPSVPPIPVKSEPKKEPPVAPSPLVPSPQPKVEPPPFIERPQPPQPPQPPPPAPSSRPEAPPAPPEPKKEPAVLMPLQPPPPPPQPPPPPPPPAVPLPPPLPAPKKPADPVPPPPTTAPKRAPAPEPLPQPHSVSSSSGSSTVEVSFTKKIRRYVVDPSFRPASPPTKVPFYSARISFSNPSARNCPWNSSAVVLAHTGRTVKNFYEKCLKELEEWNTKLNEIEAEIKAQHEELQAFGTRPQELAKFIKELQAKKGIADDCWTKFSEEPYSELFTAHTQEQTEERRFTGRASKKWKDEVDGKNYEVVEEGRPRPWSEEDRALLADSRQRIIEANRKKLIENYQYELRSLDPRRERIKSNIENLEIRLEEYEKLIKNLDRCKRADQNLRILRGEIPSSGRSLTEQDAKEICACFGDGWDGYYLPDNPLYSGIEECNADQSRRALRRIIYDTNWRVIRVGGLPFPNAPIGHWFNILRTGPTTITVLDDGSSVRNTVNLARNTYEISPGGKQRAVTGQEKYFSAPVRTLDELFQQYSDPDVWQRSQLNFYDETGRPIIANEAHY